MNFKDEMLRELGYEKEDEDEFFVEYHKNGKIYGKNCVFELQIGEEEIIKAIYIDDSWACDKYLSADEVLACAQLINNRRKANER